MAELRVAARFCGPPGFANGGVASGSLAALLGGAAEVTLRRPVPLDRSLPVHRDGGGVLVVEDGGVLLAEARPAKVALDCPSGIAAADAADLPADTAVVLGRMAATVGGRPWPGDRCRVVAWPLGGDARKLRAGSALLGPDGEVLAARTVWITVARRAVAASAGAGS